MPASSGAAPLDAGVARWFVVLATKDASLGSKGISAFVLDAEQVGVTVEKPEKKLGLRSSKTAMVTLDEKGKPRNAALMCDHHSG